MELNQKDFNYDAIVVGAGHAGIEAALALARTGCKTLIFSITLDNIGYLACNPSIGGTAKGHLVREIVRLRLWTTFYCHQKMNDFYLWTKSNVLIYLQMSDSNHRSECVQERYINTQYYNSIITATTILNGLFMYLYRQAIRNVDNHINFFL